MQIVDAMECLEPGLFEHQKEIGAKNTVMHLCSLVDEKPCEQPTSDMKPGACAIPAEPCLSHPRPLVLVIQ